MKDRYTRHLIVTLTGLVQVIGAILGNPFMPIHPAAEIFWKLWFLVMFVVVFISWRYAENEARGRVS